MKLSRAMTKPEQEHRLTRVGLNALLCFFGLHKWEYRYDAGIEKPLWKTEFVTVYFSDNRICCGRCGKQRTAKKAKDFDLPELL